MTYAVFLRLLAFGFALSPALAAAAGPEGWYLSGGVGISRTGVPRSFWLDSSITDPAMKRVGPAYQAGFGYQLDPRFALEIDYLRFAGTDFRATSDGSLTIWPEGRIHGSTELQGFSLNGVAGWSSERLPSLQLYAKGGLFFWDTLVKYSNTINGINNFYDDGVAPIGGVGGQLRLEGRWEVRAEAFYSVVRLAQRQSVGAAFATLGLVYRLQ